MRALLFLCAAAAPAVAQSVPVAGSANFSLETLSLNTSDSGFVCSLNNAARVSFGPFAGDGLSSANFGAEVGSVAIYDPAPALGPVVLGPDPSFAPMEGGTFTVKGFNFVDGGAAGPLTVEVDGVLATGVSVLSDTTLTAEAPTGASGPKTLVVSGSQGTWTQNRGFVHTPAVIASQDIPAGAPLTVRNYGPVGSVFDLWFSLQTTSIPIPAGVIQIGPNFVVLAVGGGVYPPPFGIHELTATTPQNPALSGKSIYFQTLSIISIFPFDVRLTNMDATTFQ